MIGEHSNTTLDTLLMFEQLENRRGNILETEDVDNFNKIKGIYGDKFQLGDAPIYVHDSTCPLDKEDIIYLDNYVYDELQNAFMNAVAESEDNIKDNLFKGKMTRNGFRFYYIEDVIKIMTPREYEKFSRENVIYYGMLSGFLISCKKENIDYEDSRPLSFNKVIRKFMYNEKAPMILPKQGKQGIGA